MENNEIIRQLKLTASLMELHDENPFKLRSYTTAAFNLEKFQTPLESLNEQELEEIDGVGKSMASHIREIIDDGIYSKLNELLDKTPAGVIELLRLQGFGAKKIRALWLELGIEDEKELWKACQEGKVAELKGFGEKSQASLMEAIQFLRLNRGKLLYAKAEELYRILNDLLSEYSGDIFPVGELRRKCEIVNHVEILIVPKVIKSIIQALSDHSDFELDLKSSGPQVLRLIYKPSDTQIRIYFSSDDRLGNDLFLLTGSNQHLIMVRNQEHTALNLLRSDLFPSEKGIYEYFQLPEIPPELREETFPLQYDQKMAVPELIQDEDLKGILHNHSTYSDGRHTLEDMALYCKELGYQYLGITDHSKSAFFARGMSIESVIEQHREIDKLNERLKPFRIFKGIESDILFDGSLDYPNDILETFDFVISSVHMILNMDEKKATERIIKAVSNPYTTILGHPTGRLLLEREGYPLDHKAVIDACAEHDVVIEVNANPLRLDLDWRWINYALEKNVMLSINPDAHRKSGYHDMNYGVLAARKGGLTKEMNLNSKTVEEITSFFINIKKSRLKEVQ